MIKNKHIVALTFFFVLFILFFFKNHYYAPAKLKIHGEITGYDSIAIQWDSGSGFQPHQTFHIIGTKFSEPVEIQTDYESQTYQIRHYFEEINEKQLFFEVDGWAFINGISSESSTIYIILESKNRRFAFSTWQINRPDVTELLNKGINYTNSGFFCRIRKDALPADEYKIGIAIIQKDKKGIVAFSATDNKLFFPVSNPKEEPFSKTLLLPQVYIKELLITAPRNCSALIELEDNRTLKPTSLTHNGIRFADIGLHTKKRHPLLITVQLLLSFLCAWGIYELLLLLDRKNRHGLGETLRYIFYEERRFIFWSIFFVTIFIQSLWLIGQWPGIMTVDSLIYWHNIKTLQFKEEWLYLSYLLMLIQFMDSPAVVGLFQIFIIAALGSAVFSFVIRRGISFYVLLPFLILFIFSAPIGIYNITIWKDIPFSYLIIACAFYLYCKTMSGASRENNGWKKAAMLSLLFVCLCFMRANGIVFVLLLPLIESCKGFWSPRTRVKYALMLISLFILCIYAIPSLVHEKNDPRMAFKLRTNPFAALFAAKSYYSDNYAKDSEIATKLLGIEELKKNYNPCMAPDLINMVDDSRLTKEDVNYFKQTYPKRMYENLPIFLADRISIFMSLLCSVKSVIHSLAENILIDDNHYKIIAKMPYFIPSGLTIYNLALEPKSKLLYTLQSQIDDYMRRDNHKLIFWNLLFPTIWLLCAWSLYKWFPASAIFSLIIVFQTPFLLATIMTPSYRFLYFIHIGGILLFPLVLLEVKQRCENRASGCEANRFKTQLAFAIATIFCYGLATAQHLIYCLL